MMAARIALAEKRGRNVVQLAKDLRYPSCQGIECPDCGFLPAMPVTGYCGHTRCSKCVQKNKACPCGCASPKHVHLNIAVQDLIQKMMHRKTRCASAPAVLSNPDKLLNGFRMSSTRPSGQAASNPTPRNTRKHLKVMSAESKHILCPKVRYQHAQDLLDVGEPRKAVIQLAFVAAAEHPVASRAMDLLIKVLAEMFKKCEPNRLTCELLRGVHAKNTIARLVASDFECNICFEVMWRPVTTYCGHTFCSTCILRHLDQRKQCPLCCRRLDKFDIVITKNTRFIIAAMAVSKVSPPYILHTAPEPHYIPVFILRTVAFPTLPCPFLLLGPYHRTIIRRILDAGTTAVGVITAYKDGSHPVYGTVVDIKDCVLLEDGSTMLSTIGITRFRALPRSASEEGHITQVMFLSDIVPTDTEYLDLNMSQLAQDITDKVLNWLSTLTAVVLKDIEKAFGPMPTYRREQLWWRYPDCPRWLWWIIAILPFSPELQVLMLSTNSLHKRMLAVSRTLDVILHVGLNPSVYY